MLLADLVATSEAVAATSSRKTKTEHLAELLRAAPPDEVDTVAALLMGEPRQGRIGIGWAALAGIDVDPASAPALTVTQLDQTITSLAATAGPGSSGRREEQLRRLFAQATAAEADFLRHLLGGEIRQGALAGLMTEAVAKAAGVPAAAVRRASMLSGDLPGTATLALTSGRRALDAVGLELLRGVQPMLAATAESVAAAIDDLGRAAVEWKLDGIRVQVHRRGRDVRVFTRNLNDVTDRLPELVELVSTFAADRFVLDGETIGLTNDDLPRRFQDTASRFGREDQGDHQWRLEALFFDLIHLDGTDLIDETLLVRRTALAQLVGAHQVPGTITDDPATAQGVLDEALAQGHEGVMVKAADSPYQAGRRGKSWRKVKPVHTLDLVVLAAEWGHGRRTGWLSNLHLGARDADDGFVMVGKTFKGLTDELLTWQTGALQAIAVERSEWTTTSDHVVAVRPELVVEIALDGVQASTRYPGGVALRFARVKGYRPDKDAADADTIDAVRSLLATP
ncbi:MAG: ATP-dependent DNA ligase [Acidimicrobiia bacterium]|nr:ATP-dependent DNA ligase [Acidimicrobiia bacterium]